jgi:hypothetical protein
MEPAQPLRYEEEIEAPLWLPAVLAAGMAALVTAAVALGVGREAGWKLLAWYYPLMSVAGALLLASFVSFRRLRIEVGQTAVRFRFGLFRRSLPLVGVQACEVRRYRWLTYGGWGVRFATGGRRAWSMPGAAEGVEITVAEGTKVRRYFVSSRSPELLAEAVRGR